MCNVACLLLYRIFSSAVITVVGILVNTCNAIDVHCVERIEERLSIFKSEDNQTNPYRDLTIAIPANECYIKQPIVLDENETLSIIEPQRAVPITKITFAKPSTLPEFPFVIFQTFPNLTNVHLIAMGCEVLAEDDFMGADALEQLRMELNNIETISRTSFARPVHLQRLMLPANRIRKIDEYAFEKLDDLEHLDLQQNNLTALDENIFTGADNLRTIYLNFNQIESIADGVFYMKRLTEILLQDNRLKSVSAEMLTGTPALYGIDLGRNQLTSMQNIFDKCPNLTVVGLNHNRIEDIDLIEFANLPALRILSLVGNRIRFNDTVRYANTGIHPRNNRLLAKKTRLEYLNLDSNNLSASNILHQLQVFRRLKVLDLDDNQLKEIDGFKELRKVFPHFIQINVNGNRLSCTWLEDIWASIGKQNIIFKSTELEDDDFPAYDEERYAGGFFGVHKPTTQRPKPRQWNGVPCYDDELTTTEPITVTEDETSV